MTEKKKVTKIPQPKRVRTPKKSEKSTRTIISEKSKGTLSVASFKSYFKESWQLFKVTFLMYLKLLGIGILLFMGVGLIGLLLTIPLLISSGGSADTLFSNPTSLQISGILLVILWAIASVVVFVLFSLFIAVAGIFVIDMQEKLSVKELYNKSKPLIIPYLFVSIIVSFILAGGWVVLVVPGIIFSLLFIFVSYIVVLEKKKGLDALKKSYVLVKENFLEVFVRVLVIQILVFIGSSLLDNLAKENDIFNLLSIFFSIAAGWFAQIYMYLLYKKVAKGTSVEQQVRLQWIWIIAAIGWLLVIGLIVLLSSMQIPLEKLYTDFMNQDLSQVETL